MRKVMLLMMLVLGTGLGLSAPAIDFNGDGTNDIGVFRDSNGLWAIRDLTRVYFGSSGDQPLPADYNGDGVVDMAVFRPSSNLWAIKDISRVYFGTTDDIPIGASGGGAWSVSGGNVYRSTGYVGIGTPSPSSPLDVEVDDTGYAAEFVNKHSTSNSWGILVQSGTSGPSGEGDLISFQNGAGGYLASIEFSGYTVVYNAFTGGHPSRIPDERNEEGFPYGTVMILTAARSTAERPRQAEYAVEASQRPYDKSVFGVYAGKRAKQEDQHNILTLGDGHILVTKEGGDIEIGDYLTTSSREGHAMKQNDDLLHSYTVAKAQEPVRWAQEEAESKLIACTYHAQ